MPRSTSPIALIITLTLLTLAACQSDTSAPPTPAAADQSALTTQAPPATDASAPRRMLLSYAVPPTGAHAKTVRAHGGRALKRWTQGPWVIMASMSPQDAAKLAATDPDIQSVEPDGGGSGSLMNAMEQSGTRRINQGELGQLGLSGQGQTIAIMDSGIDDTHPDLSGRVVGWMDFSGADNESPGQYPSPIDPWGHGTGVASVAAGSGQGAPGDSYAMTLSDRFPDTEGRGNVFSFPIRSIDSPAQISVLLDPLEDNGGLHGVNLLNGTNNLLERQRSVDNPFIATFEGIEALDAVDDFKYSISVYSSSSDDIATANTPYEGQITVPFQRRDEQPLTQGAAPQANLYGLKVLDDNGNFGSSEPILDALQWLYENGQDQNIAVVNASLNFNRGGPNAAVDAAINRLVTDTGIIFVASARNGQADDVPVASPATALMSVAVGAVNVHDQLTSYSSLGQSTSPITKPDILAPGGSTLAGRMVTADSNSTACKSFARNDCVFENDVFQDDYRTYTGTSFAAPHIAGVFALMLQAEGGLQYGSDTQARRLTAILKMTATEIQQGEDAEPGPPGRALAPKDRFEGHGRLNTQAALEALALQWPDEDQEANSTLGAEFGQRRAWARRIALEADSTIGIELTTPPDADYDLYLYSDNGDPQGEPIMLAHSARAGAGLNESLFYQSNADRTAIIVVKWISGQGPFTLTRQDTEALCRAPDLNLLGQPCQIGLGQCAATGTYRCADSLDSLECDAPQATEPTAELCGTGLDEDCDGLADEGFDLIGTPCEVGRGACRAQGAIVCSEDGTEQVCSAQEEAPQDELCGDGIDNDCDGTVDEGFDDLGQSCTFENEVGCTAPGTIECSADGGAQCQPQADLTCPQPPDDGCSITTTHAPTPKHTGWFALLLLALGVIRRSQKRAS